jgi:hypothetical protein
MGKSMSVEALEQEIKELADECTSKYHMECLEMSDALLTAWIIPQLPREHLNAFYFYQSKMLVIFRQRAKESINWLNI